MATMHLGWKPAVGADERDRVIAGDGKLDERSRALVEGRGWDRIGLNDLGGNETLSEVKPKRPKL